MTILNPNGIPSSSPGLRGTSYPGSTVTRVSNPNGVVSSRVASQMAATPLGLMGIAMRVPRVARASQPWAEGRCPVGAKRANVSAGTSALEREIDQQVCALYGLTPEEIAIVEGTAQ